MDILLIDCHNRIHPVFHTVRKRLKEADQDTADAVVVQTAKGFMDFIRNLLLQFPRAATVACWDHPSSAEPRRRLFPGYKQRDHDPLTGLAVHACRHVADSVQLVSWEHPDYEADDLIASVVKRYGDRKILILSNDHDLYGCLSSTVSQYGGHVFDNSEPFVTPATVMGRYGISPAQWYDFATMKSDSSDGVPGVSKIGDKTAAQILQQCGTLEEAIRWVDQLKIQPARRASLKQASLDGTVDLMRQLVHPAICPLTSFLELYIESKIKTPT